MSHFGPGDWRYDFPPLGDVADVEITGNDDAEYFSIEPVDRPRITDLLPDVRSIPRSRNRRRTTFGGQDSDLSFLPKTDLKLTISGQRPDRRGENQKQCSHAEPIGDCSASTIANSSLSWTQAAAVQLEIELVGASRPFGVAPVPVAIGLKQDLPPRVNLSFTGVKQRITPMATIPLAIQARDDYGVARLDLNHRIANPDRRIHYPATRRRRRARNQRTHNHTLLGPVILQPIWKFSAPSVWMFPE